MLDLWAPHNRHYPLIRGRIQLQAYNLETLSASTRTAHDDTQEQPI